MPTRPSAESDADGTEAARDVLAAISEGACPKAVRVAMDYALAPFGQVAAFALGLALILDGPKRLLGPE